MSVLFLWLKYMKYVRTLQGTWSHKQEKNKKRLLKSVFCPLSISFFSARNPGYPAFRPRCTILSGPFSAPPFARPARISRTKRAPSRVKNTTSSTAAAAYRNTINPSFPGQLFDGYSIARKTDTKQRGSGKIPAVIVPDAAGLLCFSLFPPCCPQRVFTSAGVILPLFFEARKR